MRTTRIVADKKIVAHGSASRYGRIPILGFVIDGIADGPVPFRYPAGDYHHDLLGIGVERLMLFNALAALGHRGIKTTATFGRAGLMLFNAVVGKPEFRKHAPLLVRQLYNVGVLSMLIIIVSGLFIGMVLGLQGYLVLTTYSAETSLGMLVARRCVSWGRWSPRCCLPAAPGRR